MKYAILCLVLCACVDGTLDPGRETGAAGSVAVSIQALSPGKYRVNNTNVSLHEGQSGPGTVFQAFASICRPYDNATWVCTDNGNGVMSCRSNRDGTVLWANSCHFINGQTISCTIGFGFATAGSFTYGGNPWHGGVEWTDGKRFGLQAPVTEVFINGF